MGKAKRRREAGENTPRLLPLNAPEMRAMFQRTGRPFNVWMIGTEKIIELLRTVPFDTLLNEPIHRPWRLGFGYFDRLRTGEIKTWACFLCQVTRPGLNELSCFAIIDREPISRDNRAVIMPICDACDCASVKTTLRRVMQDFPLEPMLEGTA